MAQATPGDALNCFWQNPSQLVGNPIKATVVCLIPEGTPDAGP